MRIGKGRSRSGHGARGGRRFDRQESSDRKEGEEERLWSARRSLRLSRDGHEVSRVRRRAGESENTHDQLSSNEDDHVFAPGLRGLSVRRRDPVGDLGERQADEVLDNGRSAEELLVLPREHRRLSLCFLDARANNSR